MTCLVCRPVSFVPVRLSLFLLVHLSLSEKNSVPLKLCFNACALSESHAMSILVILVLSGAFLFLLSYFCFLALSVSLIWVVLDATGTQADFKIEETQSNGLHNDAPQIGIPGYNDVRIPRKRQCYLR